VLRQIHNERGSRRLCCDQFSVGSLRDQDTTGPRPDLVRLEGARLVLCDEKIKNAKIGDAVFRPLVSGGVLSVRGHHQVPRDLRMHCKLVLATNIFPQLESTDTGGWRRILRYVVTKSHRDSEVKDFLTQDPRPLRAFRADLYHACLRVQRRGFAIPRSVLKDTETSRRSDDPTFGWMSNCNLARAGRCRLAGELRRVRLFPC
jgi:putative DNA primase/helicase